VILSFASAMMILLSMCGAILGLSVAERALRIFRRWNISDQENRYELEKEFYLTYVTVGVVLGIRLFAIPLYFWTLESFVPMIPGAMCLWGVFNVIPQHCWPALSLKFLFPTIYVGWLILAKINDVSKRNPLIRNLMGLYLSTLPLLVLDSLVDFSIFYNLQPIRVSCCASAIDEWPRPVPALVGGVAGQTLLLSTFLVLSSIYAILSFMSAGRRLFEWISRSLTLILIPVTVLTITEVLTPWVLHLPLHHCPFCLLYKHPAAPIFLALLWISFSGAWWALITERMGATNTESRGTEMIFRQNIWRISGVTMLISLVMVTVFVLISFI